MQLEAEFENGAKVLGESKIFYCKKREDCRIRRVRLLPQRPPALAPALAYIEGHPRELPPVSVLAELCGYTPAHFSTVFKRCFGCGPARYLQEKKIALAQERMLTADCAVGELAEEAGMEPASFSRMFKRKTGISPSQYLRRVNSDVGVNLAPDSPYRPQREFEIPKRR